MIAARWLRHRDALLLVVLTVGLFRAVLLGDEVFYIRDIHLVWHPQVEAFVRAVVSLAWPVWDPSPAFGQPLLADPSAQVLYPPTWLNLLMKPWRYYSLYAVGHFILGAFGMRALGRHLGLSPPAALTSACIFVLCGPFLSLIDLWHHYAGASWMPWVVMAADRTLEGRPRAMAGFAAALGAQVLAGSADMCAMTLLVAAVLGVARHADLRSPLLRQPWTGVARAAGGVLLGVGLSAALWVGALDVVGRAARADLPDRVRTYWSLHPLAALEMLYPGLWSSLPLAPDLRARLFESREPFLSSLYLGVSGLGLVGATVTTGRRSLRYALWAILVVSLLAALGPHTPVHGFLTTLVPPLRILRYPVKITIVTAFAWSLLAGLGSDAYREGRPGKRFSFFAALPTAIALIGAAGLASVAYFAPDRFAAEALNPSTDLDPSFVVSLLARRLLVTLTLAVATLALTAAAFRGWMAPVPVATALAAVTVLDLAVFHRTPNPTAPRELYTHRPEVVNVVAGPENRRVYVYDYSVPGKTRRYLNEDGAHGLARYPQGWTPGAASALGMQMYLFPETAGRWALSQAFNVDFRGLHASPLARLSKVLRDFEGTPAHLRFLQAGGTTHVVAMHALPDLQPERTITGLFKQPILVQRVPSPLPRTYAVDAVRRADDDAAVELLASPAFDLGRSVAIAEADPREGEAAFHGTSRIVAVRSDRIVMEAELTGPGYVVLLDTFDPGWRARVDGRPAVVHRANLAFRAVAVGSGRHRIEMVYRPRGLYLGLAVSGLSAALVVWAARKSQRAVSAS